ncbi:ubiquitin carboxyl-terminal hydrolase 2 [Anabrus simplex]|uniref:ubiquitin carboxyl-terminal hydrolase 2 n=1 Tax=Anabrus simplex TaxID=316456 RepID=UPI0034DCDEBD
MPYYSGSATVSAGPPVSYKMPVPSSSRYSSYRSSSSSLERPLYSSSTGSYLTSRSTYTTEYRSKFTSPSRTSSVPSYSRTSSLSDDSGRFTSSSRDRSESRETSSASAASSTTPSSTLGRRYNSASTISVGLSAAELYNKYSPSNYVSDIGRPPAASSTTSSYSRRSGSTTQPAETKVSTTNSRLSGSRGAVGGCFTAAVTPSTERRSRASVNEESSILNASPRISRLNTRCCSNERAGLTGLRNIGNTCFMNSVIQCLSNTKPLLEYVLADSYLAEINSTASGMKGALFKAFATVIQELWRNESDATIVNTTSLKSQIQRFAPRFMGYSQQDAQEFLRYLLEGLHEDVNRVTSKPKPILTEIDDSLSDQQKAVESWKRYLRMDDSKVVDIFVGQLKSTLRCTVCGHCSVTFDPFWDLSLPIPSRTGQVRLQQCLDHFTREEVMDGDEKPTCSKCQMRRKCTKSFTIQKFPKILVLHLKRFSPMERFRGKLNVTVDFPLTGLDLSAYAASRGQGCMYNLYGVANHSGTTYSGHYTAYCRHPYSGDWHEYNDSRVSSISSRSVVSSEAYVLFYELSGHSSHL